GKKELTVRNPRGRTVVVGKPGLRAVSVVIRKSAQGRDEADAASLLDRLEVEIGSRGGEVFVETHEDGSSNRGVWSFVKGERRTASVDYTIEVPHGFSVAASTASGEVRVSNIAGAASVSAASGDVDIRAVGGDAEITIASGDVNAVEIGGDMEVTATSGNVVIDNVKGKLELHGTSGDFKVTRIGRGADIRLTSGDLILEGCSGNLTFDAASGDARITEVMGSVEASSSSGDIEVLIVPIADRTFELSTSSGDIDVFYVAVKDYGFQLDIQTASGSIEGDLPIKVSRVDRRRLQGVVGSGAARVDIETASGDVTILERSESASKRDR
ncbi:MAG TPA: DUF4097 family beta strand repeat-containing protein, partial [Candidatus Krumholzibacteria bacterium]|nr:DUF4097 family beta strand repeat-containing protein [Candidatus Krumholzibacteria bacterium]